MFRSVPMEVEVLCWFGVFFVGALFGFLLCKVVTPVPRKTAPQPSTQPRCMPEDDEYSPPTPRRKRTQWD